MASDDEHHYNRQIINEIFLQLILWASYIRTVKFNIWNYLTIFIGQFDYITSVEILGFDNSGEIMSSYIYIYTYIYQTLHVHLWSSSNWINNAKWSWYRLIISHLSLGKKHTLLWTALAGLMTPIRIWSMNNQTGSFMVSPSHEHYIAFLHHLRNHNKDTQNTFHQVSNVIWKCIMILFRQKMIMWLIMFILSWNIPVIGGFCL